MEQTKEDEFVRSYCRPIVRDFAKGMETRLRRHDLERGNTWKTQDAGTLFDSLEKEMKEFKRTVLNDEPSIMVRYEAFDVANYLMFLSENYQSKRVKIEESARMIGRTGE
jgi:adenosyl cobinamide kinase/adenosyl cobinamide phosphate guanylyltransferase